MRSEPPGRIRGDDPMNTNYDARHGGSELPEFRQAEAAEGMILVDLALRPVAMDNGGHAILNELDELARAGSPARLPDEIKATLNGATPAELDAITIRINGSESQYNCHVFLLQPQNGVIAEPLFAIHFKRERSVLEAVRRIGRTYHLTAREQEALIGISMGLTSRQLAERMTISPNTVNAFLRLIMVKMGVTT